MHINDVPPPVWCAPNETQTEEMALEEMLNIIIFHYRNTSPSPIIALCLTERAVEVGVCLDGADAIEGPVCSAMRATALALYQAGALDMDRTFDPTGENTAVLLPVTADLLKYACLLRLRTREL